MTFLPTNSYDLEGRVAFDRDGFICSSSIFFFNKDGEKGLGLVTPQPSTRTPPPQERDIFFENMVALISWYFNHGMMNYITVLIHIVYEVISFTRQDKDWRL